METARAGHDRECYGLISLNVYEGSICKHSNILLVIFSKQKKIFVDPDIVEHDGVYSYLCNNNSQTTNAQS